MYMDSPGKYLSHALCLLYKRHEKIIIHKKVVISKVTAAKIYWFLSGRQAEFSFHLFTRRVFARSDPPRAIVFDYKNSGRPILFFSPALYVKYLRRVRSCECFSCFSHITNLWCLHKWSKIFEIFQASRVCTLKIFELRLNASKIWRYKVHVYLLIWKFPTN